MWHILLFENYRGDALQAGNHNSYSSWLDSYCESKAQSVSALGDNRLVALSCSNQEEKETELEQDERWFLIVTRTL